MVFPMLNFQHLVELWLKGLLLKPFVISGLGHYFRYDGTRSKPHGEVVKESAGTDGSGQKPTLEKETV